MAEVTCAHCSYWERDAQGRNARVQIKHISVAAVKACALKALRNKTGE
jgi:hypothetical protein